MLLSRRYAHSWTSTCHDSIFPSALTRDLCCVWRYMAERCPVRVREFMQCSCCGGLSSIVLVLACSERSGSSCAVHNSMGHVRCNLPLSLTHGYDIRGQAPPAPPASRSTHQATRRERVHSHTVTLNTNETSQKPKSPKKQNAKAPTITCSQTASPIHRTVRIRSHSQGSVSALAD